MTITIQKHSLRLDTKKYTVQDILDEIYEDRDLLVALGLSSMKDYKYTAQINTRAKRRCGQCKRISAQEYSINISEQYLRNCPPSEIHNTIMHEVIHSAPGCMNHGATWQNIAHRVNQKYQFTPIQRLCEDATMLNLVKEQARYYLRCPRCNKEYRWIRKPKHWDAYSRGLIRCGCCHQPFETEMKR